MEVGLALTRNPGDFPAPASLRDQAKAQVLDPAKVITLEADSWEDESGDDFVQVMLTTAEGEILEASTPWPGRTRGGVLDIAGGRLEYNQTYLCRLRRYRITAHDIDRYPGATGWVGLFTETVCPVRTVPSPDRVRIVSPAKETLPVGDECLRWLEVEGGLAPLAWEVIQGSPPKGVDFDSKAGRFRGWPASPDPRACACE